MGASACRARSNPVMRWRRPPDVATIRTAWWTVRSLRAARAQLRHADVRDLRLDPPPDVGPSGIRGVWVVLRLRPGTCLTRAAVRQAWLAAQGQPFDLVIGVTAPSRGFKAHAWLEGDP